MKPIVITKLGGADNLPEADGARVSLETSEGPLEIRLTYEHAEALIAALQKAREKIQAQRVKAAKPPLPESRKTVERWETAIDPVNQDAILRARYTDQTTQEMRIPRTEVPIIAMFLDHAAKRMEPGTDMRQ